MSQLLNVADAARKLGFSRHGLYKATARHGIPHVRIGHVIRWDEADLDRFIDLLKTRAQRCAHCGQSVRHLRIRKAV